MSYFIVFLTSALLSGFIVVTTPYHSKFTSDRIHGAQKIHNGAIPRVGGLSIALAVIFGGVTFMSDNQLWTLTALCTAPVFIVGFWEDLTKRVSVRARLLVTISAGGLFVAVTGYSLHHLSLPGVDFILRHPALATAFTAFAIGGVANAMNIIDGCNGLSSGTSIILFIAFGAIAYVVRDTEILSICLLYVAAIVGFLVWNFPMGKIFLGDAGAYSVGFALATVAVALPARHAEISPVIGLLILSYPVGETLYSVVRRARLKTGGVGQPDSGHLHSLTFKALERRVQSDVLRNSMAGAAIWVLPLISGALAYMLRSERSAFVLLACVGHFALYCGAYGVAKRAARNISSNETPKWSIEVFTLPSSDNRKADKALNTRTNNVHTDATGI